MAGRMRSAILGLAVIGLSLTGPAEAALDRHDALTSTSARAQALATAIARLDPTGEPLTVVCRTRDGRFAVTLIKWAEPDDPFIDGMHCSAF
jgi:hypothetical protein